MSEYTVKSMYLDGKLIVVHGVNPFGAVEEFPDADFIVAPALNLSPGALSKYDFSKYNLFPIVKDGHRCQVVEPGWSMAYVSPSGGHAASNDINILVRLAGYCITLPKIKTDGRARDKDVFSSPIEWAESLSTLELNFIVYKIKAARNLSTALLKALDTRMTEIDEQERLKREEE